MNGLVWLVALIGLIGFVLVWSHSLLRQRTLRKQWQQCLKDAATIVAGVKSQYPGCDGAVNLLAGALDTDLRQSSSAYKNISFEDYMRLFSRVKAEETPVFSMSGSDSSKSVGEARQLENTEFSWTVDLLPDPIGALGPPDGYAIQDTEIRNVTTNVRKMGNIGQAFRRAHGAGWIANQVTSTPIGNLITRGRMDRQLLLKQDIEVALCSLDQTAVQDAGGTSGCTMAGLRKLIDKANQYAAASAFAYGKPTDLHYAPTGATLTTALSTTFTYSAFRTMIKELRKAAAMNVDLTFICGLDTREAVTNFILPTNVTAGATGTSAVVALNPTQVFTQTQDDDEYGITIAYVRTDYGRIRVIPTRRIGDTAADSADSPTNVRADRVFNEKPKAYYFIDPKLLWKRWGVRFQSGKLADNGGGDQEYERCFLSMGVTNPSYFGWGSMS